MNKTVSLKELPDIYISSGMSLSDLSSYLKISEEVIKEWENFFNLAPKKVSGVETLYTKDKIQEFIKIKGFVEKGRSLKEIKEKVYNVPLEVISNPFEGKRNFSEFKPAKQNIKPYTSSGYVLSPFLSQLHKANEQIGELIFEKAKIVEDTAIEKASLLSKIKNLKTKNEVLLEEKQNIAAYIKDKKEQIAKISSREDTLAKALMISQEILNKKEDEIIELRSTIKLHEQEINAKSELIQEQSLELNNLLEKQNRKWWKFWK